MYKCVQLSITSIDIEIIAKASCCQRTAEFGPWVGRGAHSSNGVLCSFCWVCVSVCVYMRVCECSCQCCTRCCCCCWVVCVCVSVWIFLLLLLLRLLQVCALLDALWNRIDGIVLRLFVLWWLAALLLEPHLRSILTPIWWTAEGQCWVSFKLTNKIDRISYLKIAGFFHQYARNKNKETMKGRHNKRERKT